MRPVIVSTSGAATVSPPVVLDYITTPFNVSVACVVTGTVAYTVEHTFDDPYGPTGLASATWFPHDVANLVAATSNQNGNFISPVRAARINQATGAGSVTGTFLQGIIY